MTSQRFLHIDISAIAGDVFLTQLDGYAGLSEPFEFDLQLAYYGANIDPNSVLGKTATISIGHDKKTPQYFHGIITDWAKSPADYSGLSAYRCIVKPWFSLLKQVQDCRGFIDQTVIEIAHTMVENMGFSHLFHYKKLNNAYPEIPYCAQYNESCFDFISRLLERYGINYDFQFDHDQHMMVLDDSGLMHHKHFGTFDYRHNQDGKPRIEKWTRTISMVSNQFSSRVTHPAQPKKPLDFTQVLKTPAHENKHQQYHHSAKANTHADLEYLNRVKADAEQLKSLCFNATTNALGLYPGSSFQLKGHPDEDDNGEYFIRRCHYHADDYTGIRNHAPHKSPSLRVDIEGHPDHLRFVPAQNTPKPSIEVAQSAVVRGPKGQEIYSQGYAEIKIQFHWDRYSQDNLSLMPWVRTRQMMAGNQWGAQFIPRVGQEVLVTFADGDPDQPLVLGVVPNANTKPPFSLPQNAALSGFKTHTIGSTDKNAGHSLIFNDAANDEAIIMRSQRDLNINVKGSAQKHVGNDSTTTVNKGQWCVNVEKGQYILTANKEIRLMCGSSEISITTDNITVKAESIAMDTFAGGDQAIKTQMPTTDIMKKLNEKLATPYDKKRKTQSVNHLFEGLQTIKVKPAWRKIIPGENIDDFSTLFRLPTQEIHRVLQYVIDQYQTDKLDPAEQLKQDSALLKATDLDKQMPTDLTYLESIIKDQDLLDEIHAQLNLNTPEPLREGWVYIFAQCNGGPAGNPFKQTHLFKEYEIRNAGDISTFYEIDLSEYAGLDERLAGRMTHTIELPYQYEKNGQSNGKFEVQIMFSGVQLSWPRIHRLGGLDQADPRIQILKKTIAESEGNEKINTPDQGKKHSVSASLQEQRHQINLINKLQSNAVDDKLREKRCGKILRAIDLDAIYKVQYQHQDEILLDTKNTYDYTDWQEQSLYYYESGQHFPTLLLDDPLGMVLMGNQTIIWLQQKLLAIVNQLSTDETMRTALVAYQFFYNLRADGLTNASDDGFLDKRKNSFDDMKKHFKAITGAQKHFNLKKFQLALQQVPRKIIKRLMSQAQKSTIETLEATDNTAWTCNTDEAITDYFAHGTHHYGQAHAAYFGLWSLSCLDSDSIDAALEASPFPENELNVTHPATHAVVTANNPSAAFTSWEMDMMTIDGYQATIYERHKFEVLKKIKTYQGNQLISFHVTQSQYKTLEKPAGYDYLDKLMKRQLTIAKIVLPIVNDKPTFDQESHDKYYLLGDGSYNAEALRSAQEVLHKNMEEHLGHYESDGKPAENTVEKGKEGVTGEIQSQFNPFIDGVTSLLSKVLLDKPDSEITTIKQTVFAMLTDINGLSRDHIKVGEADNGVLLSVEMLTTGETRFSKQINAQLEANVSTSNAVYQVHLEEEYGQSSISDPKDTTSSDQNSDSTLKHEKTQKVYYFDCYEDATDAINKQRSKEIDRVKQALKKQSDSLKSTAAYIKKGLLGTKLPLSGALTWLAWGEVEESYINMNEEPSFYTVTYFGLQLAAGLNAVKELSEHFADFIGIEREMNIFSKSHLIQALDKKRFFAESTSLFEVLGVVTSVYDIIQDTMDWYHSMGKNNPKLALSNFMEIVSDEALLAGGGKVIADNVAEKAGETDGLSGLGDKGAMKGTASAEKSWTESSFSDLTETEVFDSIEVIGDLIPGADIFFLIATAAQITSLVLAYFRDNDYEIWAKKSMFKANELCFTLDPFPNQTSEYAVLLNLIASPKIDLLEDPKSVNNYRLIMNTAGKFHGKAYLSAYLSTKELACTIKSEQSADEYWPLQEIPISARPILLADNMNPVGFSANISKQQLPTSQMITPIAIDSAHGLANMNMAPWKIERKHSLKEQVTNEVKRNLQNNSFVLYGAGQLAIQHEDLQFTLPNHIVKSQDTDAKDLAQYFQNHDLAYAGITITLSSADQKKIIYDVQQKIALHQTSDKDLIRVKT